MTEVVDRDGREMETLMQARQKLKAALEEVFSGGFYFLGKMSEDWNLFDLNIFIVRLFFPELKRFIQSNSLTLTNTKCLSVFWNLLINY